MPLAAILYMIILNLVKKFRMQILESDKSYEYLLLTLMERGHMAYAIICSLDTTTGFVWILTHRTLATGREPVAIPYKFIKISPKNQKDFMVEDTQNVPMPLSRIP